MKSARILVLLVPLLIFALLQSCKEYSTVQPTQTTTNTNSPPGPVLVSPSNDSITQQQGPTLKWQNFATATVYRVQVSFDANFAGTMIMDSSGITGLQVNIPQTITRTGPYFYWRVIATIPGGLSPWSSTWRFRIVLAPPAAPTPVLPPNNSTGQSFTPLFRWDTVAYAQFFRIQVSANQNFTQILLDSNSIYSTQMQCPAYILITSTQYFWRVNASNSDGLSVGPWSSTFNFTTLVGPLPNSISGVVTFVDSTFVYPFNYFVGLWTYWNPTTNTPYAIDTISLQHNGNHYTASYLFRNLPNGRYYVATMYSSSPDFFNDPILGIYGCDTVHLQYSGCPTSPTGVMIQNNFGQANINLLTWADTTKRIFPEN